MNRLMLCVSQFFPPIPTAAAYQTERVLSSLRPYGFDAVIYCGRAGAGTVERPPQKDGGCEVHATPSLWRFRLFRALVRHAPLLAFDIFGVSPMSFPFWNLPLCFRSLFFERRRFDLLFTLSTPVADHLTGLFLKQRLKLPWAAYFSDPWTRNPLTPVSARRHLPLHEAVKKKVFTKADLLIFTTEETRAAELDGFPADCERKSRVIPHAFCPQIDAAVPLAPLALAGKVLFRYVGNFGEGRTPEALFRGIALAKRQGVPGEPAFQFEFFGSPYRGMQELKAKYGLGAEVIEAGRVPFLESLGCMKGADVLVHVDVPGTDLFLASKLVDYVAARKPILGIMSGKGTASSLVRAANGFIASPDSPQEIADRILEIVGLKQSGGLAQRIASDGLRDGYSLHSIGRRYAEAFDTLLARR